MKRRSQNLLTGLFMLINFIACKKDPVNSTTNNSTNSTDAITYIHIIPSNALYDPESQLLYLFNADSITLYNVPSKVIVTQITAPSTIGYSDEGIYNNKKELYVPCRDSTIYIYDAATLNQTGKINTNTSVSDVVYNNGFLFAIQDNTIYSYSRGTQQLVSQFSGMDMSIIKKVPGSNTNIFGMSISYQSPISYYQFDSTGSLGYRIFAYTSTSLPTASSPAILEVLPDGNHAVYSSNGTIMNTQIQFASTSLSGKPFTSFDIDSTNNLIYAGCPSDTIKVYSASDYHFIRSISTKGYPFKVFHDNNTIISVSQTAAKDKIFIEQFPIN